MASHPWLVPLVIVAVVCYIILMALLLRVIGFNRLDDDDDAESSADQRIDRRAGRGLWVKNRRDDPAHRSLESADVQQASDADPAFATQSSAPLGGDARRH